MDEQRPGDPATGPTGSERQPDWGPSGAQPQAGWGQPQAGWGPQGGVGPSQPGWGQPQPGWGQPQPGWGQPQPGWGVPPNAPGRWMWSRAGWAWVPERPTSFAGRHKIALVLGGLALIVAVLVGACVVTVLPPVMKAIEIEDASNGRMTDSSYDWENGVGGFWLQAAPDVDEEEAASLACDVVWPALRGTQFESTPFVIVDQEGRILADEETPCP